MDFKPLIAERKTNELIRIDNNPEGWNSAAVEQAKKELLKRNISQEFQEKKLAIWQRFYKRKNEVIVQKRAEVGYDWSDIIINPISFILEIIFDWNLKTDGYLKKHEQRKFLLIFMLIMMVIVFCLIKYGR